MADVQQPQPVVAEMAQAAEPPAPVPEVPEIEEPTSETLYIQNLNEKIKVDVIKQSLRALFKNYGDVLDVVAHGNLRMRGQAFVSFESKDVAGRAKKEVVGFPLYGKPMQISYAKTRSDAVVKKLDANSFDEHKKQREEHKKQTRYTNPLKQKLKAKRTATEMDTSGAALPAPKRPQVQMPDEYLPPNKILFVQNLPTDIPNIKQVLHQLFSQYPNLHEIRLIPTKPDIAFVEYTDEDSSTNAKDGLHNWKLGEGKIKITFARK